MIAYCHVKEGCKMPGPASHDDFDDCRACVSVEELMKRGKQLAEARKAKGDRGKEEGAPGPSRSDCPADKDSLGRASWTLLHSIAAYFPEKPTAEQQQTAKQFMQSLAQLYPCSYCAEDLRGDLKDEPPTVKSRQEFATWMCRLHNKVNEKMGKPPFDCAQLEERWRRGWKDGSCDEGGGGPSKN